MRTMTWSSHSDAIPFPSPRRASARRSEFSTSLSAQPDTSRRGQARAKENLRMRSEAMSYKHTAKRLANYRRQIRELRQKMRDVQAAVEPEPAKDYMFRRAGGGSVRLSELFGDKADLFVIHNMGQSCPYCPLWAGGFHRGFSRLSKRA